MVSMERTVKRKFSVSVKGLRQLFERGGIATEASDWTLSSVTPCQSPLRRDSRGTLEFIV